MCGSVTAGDRHVRCDCDAGSESWIFGTENSRAGVRLVREGGRGAVRVAPPCEQPAREVSASPPRCSSLDTSPGRGSPPSHWTPVERHRTVPTEYDPKVARVEYPSSWIWLQWHIWCFRSVIRYVQISAWINLVNRKCRTV